MAELIQGSDALRKRLLALQTEGKMGEARMLQTAITVRGLMATNMPRKTGTTAGSLQPRNVTPVSAEIVGSPVAVWIDTGTGLYGPHHQKITPKAAKALRFHWKGAAPAGAKYRLSGTMTVGSVRKFGPSSDLVYVRSVKGMQARPYITKSVEQASVIVGAKLAADLVRDWNNAA